MSGKSLTQAMFTNAATDGLNDARSLRRKAAAQRKLRKAVGAWFDQLEARQMLNAIISGTGALDNPYVINEDPGEAAVFQVANLSSAFGISNTNGSVSFDPATGTIRYTPNTNYNGVAQLKYRLNNGTEQTVTFNVRDVNDGPTFDFKAGLPVENGKPIINAVEDTADTYKIDYIISNLGVGPADEVAAGQTIDRDSVTVTTPDEAKFVPGSLKIVQMFEKNPDGTDKLVNGQKVFLGYQLQFQLVGDKSGDATVNLKVSDTGAIRADGRGDVNTTTKQFIIRIEDVNDPTQVGTQIVAPDATQGADYNFNLPASAFTDIDPAGSETITYQAEGLPSWLRFDNNNTEKVWHFYGKPTAESDVGSVTIKVTALDRGGWSVFQNFTLKVNDRVDNPVQNPNAPFGPLKVNEDETLSFTLPANMFTDPDLADQGKLVYTVRLDGDNDLPSWIEFTNLENGSLKNQYGKLTIRPTNANVGTLWLVVKAVDNRGGYAFSSRIALTVENTIDVPVLKNQIQNQPGAQDLSFTYTVPANTFEDVDAGDQAALAYKAEWLVTENGQEIAKALPSWLSFDPATRRFSGLPTSKDPGNYKIRVTVTDPDPSHATATCDFFINIADAADAPYSDPITGVPEGIESKQFNNSADGFSLMGFFHDDDATYGQRLDRLTFTAMAINPDGTEAQWPTWLEPIVNSPTAALKGVPGHNDVGQTTIKVIATDTTNRSTSRIFTLTVKNFNNAPTANPITVTPTVEQDGNLNWALPANTFVDIDLGYGDALTYTAEKIVAVEGQPTQYVALPAWLQINSANGTFTGTPRNADVGTYQIRVTATDKAGEKVSTNFTLVVTNKEDDPRAIGGVIDRSIREGQLWVYEAKNDVYDPDTLISVGETVNYEVFTVGENNTLGPKPAWLHINAATGQLSGTPSNGDVTAFSQTGPLKLRVVCTDVSTNKSAYQDYRVAITDIPEAPVAANPFGAAPAAVVGQLYTFTVPALTFVDPDQNDSYTLSAKQADGSALPSWLSFDPVTRTFSGTPSAFANYQITLSATDTTGLVGTMTFGLRVGNPNQVPVVVAPIPDWQVLENTTDPFKAVTYTIPAGTFVDPDANDTLTYTADWDRTKFGWLTFDPTTRTFSGQVVKNFAGRVDITVTAKDSSGATASDVFTFEVVNVNQGPSFPSITDVYLNQEETRQFVISPATDADLPYGDQLTYTAVQLKWEQPQGSAGSWVAYPLPSWIVFNPGTQSFTVTPPTYYAGDTKVQVTVSDRYNEKVSQIFNIHVLNTKNDAPISGTLADVTLLEDQAWKLVLPGNLLRDPDLGLDAQESVSYQIFWLEQIGVANGQPVYMEHATGSQLWMQMETNPITSADPSKVPTLIGTPDDVNIGTTRYRVRATDRLGLHTDVDFNVTVLAVNDAPIVTFPDNLAVNENVTEPTAIPGISVTDQDAGNQTISLQLTAGLGTLQIDGLSGMGLQFSPANGKGQSIFLMGSAERIRVALAALKYMPPSTYVSTDSIAVVADDRGNVGAGGPKTDLKYIPIHINAINHAPVANNDTYGSITEDRTQAYILNVTLNDSKGPANEAGQKLRISSVNPTGAHGTVAPFYDAVDGLWKIAYTPDANYYGPVSFTYRVMDDGNPALESNDATVSFNVDGVNDVPDFTLAQSITVNENDNTKVLVATNITPGPGEEKDQTVTFEVSVTQGANLFDVLPQIDASGKLVFQLKDQANGTVKMTVRMRDNLGLYDTHNPASQLTMTVNPVNDGPRFGTILLGTINENTVANPTSVRFTGEYLLSAGVDPEGRDYPLSLVPGSIQSDVYYDASDTAHANPHAYGTVIGPDINGYYTFIPAQEYWGDAWVVFKAKDSTGVETTAKAKVTMLNTYNNAPTTAPDVMNMEENSGRPGFQDSTPNVDENLIDVVKNDHDVNMNGKDYALWLVPSKISRPAHGTAVVVDNNTIRYIPDVYFNGQDSFTYTITDQQGREATGTVTVNVSRKDYAPVAYGDSAATREHNMVTIPVLVNDEIPDSDQRNDTMIVVDSIISGPAHGTAVLTADGLQIQYTPTGHYNGMDTFQYRIKTVEKVAGTVPGFVTRYATATVTLTVYNDPNDDTYVVNKDASSYTFDPLANDVNRDPAAGATWVPVLKKITVYDMAVESGATSATPKLRTYTVDQLAGKTITFANPDGSNVARNGGTLTYNASTKQFTYKPKAGQLLSDTFTYEVDAGNTAVGANGIVTRTVMLNVNQPPTAGDLDLPVDLGQDNLLPDILTQSGVTDDQPGSLRLTAIGSASKGTARLVEGRVYYRPGDNFDGKDTFTYTITDSNGVTATGKINVLFTRANDDAFTVDANTFSNTLKILDNDYRKPGVTWQAVEILSGPAHGKLTINSDLSLNYVPYRHYYNDNDPANPEAFTYRVQASNGVWYGTAENPIKAKVTVRRVNEAPQVIDDTYGDDANAPIMEDSTNVFDVLANDREVDGEAFWITSVTQGTEGGQVSITADGKIQYKPKANWNSEQVSPARYDRFTYQVRDVAGNISTGTVSVRVKPVNDDPVATNDTSGVGTFPSVAGNSVNNTLPVLENDANPDAPNGESYTITAVQGTSAQGGTVVINGNGILYTPAAHFAGTDTFTYTIQDNSGSGKTSTATVTVTVTRLDENPTAKNDAVSVNENGQIASSITINVNDLMANDESLDGDAKIFDFDSLNGGTKDLVPVTANGGTLTRNKDAGTITYTPAPYFRGTDSFTYTMKDPAGHSSTATVTVTVNAVNQAPVTTDYLVTTTEDTDKMIVVATDLAGSFTDPHGDVLKVTSVTQPENGTVTPVFDPFGRVVSFTYKPKLNFFTAANKTDNFTYTVVDSFGASATGTVKVTVVAVNDAPVARDQAFTVYEDSGVVELNVFNMLNQDNPDQGEPLTLMGVMNVPAELTGKVNIVGGKIMFTAPTTNTTAQSYTFNYVVRDADNLSATGKVTVTIVNVNDAPIANPDAATVNEDAVLTLTQDNLRGNDLDEESRPDTTKPAAVLTVVDVKSTDNTHGTVELKSDGSIVFTPAKDYNGQATFKYVVSDGDKTSEGTVTVTVNPVNDAPVVKASATAKVNEDATLELLPADLVKAELVGDVDNGDVLFVSGVAASNGNTVEMRDGKIYFTAAKDFNGLTSFTYTVSDGHGGTATGTVNVTVDPVNDAPTLGVINESKTFAKKEGELLTFSVTGQDIDTGDTLRYSLVNAPAGATIDPVTGVFSWTPGYDQGANPARAYSFFVKVSDSGGLYAVQPVNVTVADVPLPDSIVVTGDLKEGTTFTATYTGNSTDRHFVWKVNGTVVQVEKADHTWTSDLTTIPYKPADNGEYTIHVDVWNKDQTAIVDTAERKVTVADVAPTIALTDGTVISEGQTYGLTLGAITDPGADTVTKYAVNWGDSDITQSLVDGSPANTKVFHAYADSGTYKITVTLVNEDGVFYNAGTLTVKVNNVAPTATFTASSTVAEGSAATASFTNQMDISPADMKAGFTYQYDFNNDGTFDLTTKDASVSVPANMLKAGQNTVKGRIQDAEGAYSDYTATINVTNVAPIVDLGAELTVGTNTAFTRTGSFIDPGTGTWTATVDYGDGQGAQPLTLNGKQFTLSHTYAAAGVYNVKVVVNDGTATGEGTLKVTAGQSQLQVTNVTATPSGFDIQFNMPIDLSKLNLYDGVASKGRAADLTIVGAKSGAVSGTAIWEAATNTLHFVKTGGLLAADSYSVTLFSRADGFVGLDGDKDGNAGGNFVQSVNVAAATGLTATMPDIARGPKQSFSLPIRLSDTAGVQSFDAELQFDPTLLNVSEVERAAGLPGDWTAVMNVLSPGRVKITAYGTTSLTAGAKDLLLLKASVPSTATYAAAGMLKLQNVVVNDTAVVGDTAVQAVAYLGDASGNKNYTGMDAAFIANVVIGAVKGFDAFPTIDPVIIGDVNGNGSIGGLDASFVAQKSVGMARPEIPDLPAAPVAPLAAKATATTNTAVAKKAAATVQAKKVFASGQIRVASTNSALIGKTTQKVQAPVFGGKKIESDILK